MKFLRKVGGFIKHEVEDIHDFWSNEEAIAERRCFQFVNQVDVFRQMN